MCTPSFIVCAHLTTCVCTHAHSLEGTLIASEADGSNYG